MYVCLQVRMNVQMYLCVRQCVRVRVGVCGYVCRLTVRSVVLWAYRSTVTWKYCYPVCRLATV